MAKPNRISSSISGLLGKCLLSRKGIRSDRRTFKSPAYGNQLAISQLFGRADHGQWKRAAPKAPKRKGQRYTPRCAKVRAVHAHNAKTIFELIPSERGFGVEAPFSFLAESNQ